MENRLIICAGVVRRPGWKTLDIKGGDFEADIPPLPEGYATPLCPSAFSPASAHKDFSSFSEYSVSHGNGHLFRSMPILLFIVYSVYL